MEIISAWKSETGRIRTSNEDNLFVDGMWIEDGVCKGWRAPDGERSFHTFAVCDGMGGESYGEVASLLAMKTLEEFDAPELQDNFEKYIEAANERICEETLRRNVNRMGAAIVLLAIDGERLGICNLGDCRVYRFDSMGFIQLSVDHRVDVPGVRKGALSQHLGVPMDEFLLEPYVRTEMTVDGNAIFLLCSDGLTDMVSEDELLELFRNGLDDAPEAIAERTVQAALNHGGRDNVTVIVVKAQSERD